MLFSPRINAADKYALWINFRLQMLQIMGHKKPFFFKHQNTFVAVTVFEFFLFLSLWPAFLANKTGNVLQGNSEERSDFGLIKWHFLC
jgi:hypothetical protein